MFKKKRLTRLGDILVNKGLITKEQLARAVEEQARRKRLLDPADKTAVVTPLGEILIELGYIDRLQLKRGLNWQLRLRHASIAMALCAPFMMFAPSASASVTRTPLVTIEAEDYSSMSGVVNEATLDVGGGKHVGYIDIGDWMEYKDIDIPATGDYRIVYRVASPGGGAVIALKDAAGASLGSVTIPKTGGWDNWTDVEHTVSLQKGVQNLRIFAQMKGFNINWFRIEKISATEATPPSGLPQPISVVIQSEDYSSQKGVISEATTDTGGGKNVGAIAGGDSMSYENSPVTVPVTGKYKMSYRVASPQGGGSIELSNLNTKAIVDTIPVPKTGGWQKWVTVEREVTLNKGEYKFSMLAQKGGFNINWFKVESIAIDTGGQTSSSSSAAPEQSFPLFVQAEDYSSMSGVVKETTLDVGGGQNVGYIDTGDWMEYKAINIPASQDYKIVYRVAARDAGSIIALKDAAGTSLGSIAIPKTGGWNNWIDVEHIIRLQKGVQNLRVFAQVGGFNINWFRIEKASATGTSSSSGLPQPISVVIQSEDYSSQKGVISEATTDTGGGKNVGAIAGGDSMSYENSPVTVPVTGKYKMSYRVASPQGGGSIELSNLNTKAIVDTIPVPKTGGWQKWVTVEREVMLNKGEYKFSMLAQKGGFNINWFKVESIATNAGGQSSSSSSSAAAVSSSKSSSSAPAVSSSSKSSTPSMSSSSWSSSSTGPTHVAGSVAITWSAPDRRENGDPIYIDELGGYEIRYKKAGDSRYTYISINDPWTQNYKFDWLEGDYIFQIAAFDKEGVYSPFVDIQRQ